MTAASFEWLGLAIVMVAHEVARSGRPEARVRRMYANNERLRDKGLRRTLNGIDRMHRAEKADEIRRVAEAKREAVAKAHEELAAKAEAT